MGQSPSSTLNHLLPQAAASPSSPFCVSQMLPDSLAAKNMPCVPQRAPCPKMSMHSPANPQAKQGLPSMANLASGTYTSIRSGLKSVLRLCQPHTAVPAVKAGAILFSLERSVRDRNDSVRLHSTGHCTGGHRLQQCLKSTSSPETQSSLRLLGQHI